MAFDYAELAWCTPDVLEKIRKAESEQRLNDHLDPIDSEGSLPVDENFPFIPGFFLRSLYAFRKFYFLNGFIKRLNKKTLRTTVTGKENLLGVKSAVFVCNHVNKFDTLAVNYALGKKKLKVMVAEFNNRDGFLGKMMRADGILPFKPEKKCIKLFSDAVNYYLQHGTSVLFFPEGSEWWCYKKPRPLLDGAFHYASSNSVPIVPLFITFSDDGIEKNGVVLPAFTVNILKPIMPDSSKTKKENNAFLKEKVMDSWQSCYKSVYGDL